MKVRVITLGLDGWPGSRCTSLSVSLLSSSVFPGSRSHSWESSTSNVPWGGPSALTRAREEEQLAPLGEQLEQG